MDGERIELLTLEHVVVNFLRLALVNDIDDSTKNEESTLVSTR